MLRKPEEGQSAISKVCGTTTWTDVWPTHVQPMPHLRFKLNYGYLANENWVEALRHILPVCLVSDPVLFHRSHPVPVGRWYLLICILAEVMEQQKREEAEVVTCLAGISLPMVYKHYLLRLSESI